MEAWLLLLALAGVYLVACQIWPYTACGRCSKGKHVSPSGKAWRNCGRCAGSGRRLRVFAARR